MTDHPNDPPTNAAMRRLADKHELRRIDLARLLHVSESTVFSWFRSAPHETPMMALELLCKKLGEKFPPKGVRLARHRAAHRQR